MSWKEFESESTENLMEYIGWWRKTPEDLDTSTDAFQAFCFRFQADLLHKCRIIARNWGYGIDVGDEIAERTFKKVWLYGKYDKASASTKAKDVDSAVKFYLYKIASHELADYRKEQLEPPSPYTGEEDIIRDFPSIENFPTERKAELVRIQEITERALARLSPKHKIIYLTYSAYQHSGHKMPRGLLQKMRDELELTQATIQFYKKQAVDTIQQYLELYGSK